ELGGPLDPVRGVAAGHSQELAVLAQVGDLEGGEAALAGAEDLAEAADVEVGLGEFEAVGGADDRAQPLLGLGRGGLADEDAGGGLVAAADAPAKLVK